MAIPDGGGFAAEAGGSDGFVAFVSQQRTRSSKGGEWRRAAALTTSGILVLAVVMVFSDSGAPASSSLAENGQAAAALPPLTELQAKEAKDKLKSLRTKIVHEQDTASKLDAKVAKEEAAFKGKLLKAKSLEQKSKLEESKEEEETKQAKALEAKAAEREADSKHAKQKFVANEKPMEKATTLAAHDKRAFRKAELAVAAEVSKLSANPTDAKLRGEVQKLVGAAKTAKATMEADSTLLTNIEKRVASVQVGGKGSYNSLMRESMSLDKQAEQLSSDAAILDADAKKRKASADAILAKVEADMKGPEKLHAEAAAARKQYEKQTLLAKKLEAELEKAGAADAQKASKAAQKQHKTGLSSGGGDASSSSSSSSSSSAEGGGGDSSSDPAPKILSTGQSTFLSGLFSHTAPWDKGYDTPGYGKAHAH